MVPGCMLLLPPTRTSSLTCLFHEVSCRDVLSIIVVDVVDVVDVVVADVVVVVAVLLVAPHPPLLPRMILRNSMIPIVTVIVIAIVIVTVNMNESF